MNTRVDHSVREKCSCVLREWKPFSWRPPQRPVVSVLLLYNHKRFVCSNLFNMHIHRHPLSAPTVSRKGHTFILALSPLVPYTIRALHSQFIHTPDPQLCIRVYRCLQHPWLGCCDQYTATLSSELLITSK